MHRKDRIAAPEVKPAPLGAWSGKLPSPSLQQLQAAWDARLAAPPHYRRYVGPVSLPSRDGRSWGYQGRTTVAGWAVTNSFSWPGVLTDGKLPRTSLPDDDRGDQ